MARLKFFVFVVIAVGIAAFAVSSVSGPSGAGAEATAGDAARYAALAASGEVSRQQEALSAATLLMRTSPEVAAVLESPSFGRPGLTAEERLERLRVPVLAALPEELRASTRVWLLQEGGVAQATLDAPSQAVEPAGMAPVVEPSEAPDAEDEAPVEAPVEALAPAAVIVPERAGLQRLGEVPYVVSALELTPARGRLFVAVPLRLQPFDALVEGASTSIALMGEGAVLASAGTLGADVLLSQLAGAPVGTSAAVQRGASASLGPLTFPLFTATAPDQTVQRVGSRLSLAEGLEIGAITEISRSQAALAEAQKTGVVAVGALAVLGLLGTLLMGGARASKKKEEDASSDGEPLRASLSVLPLDSGRNPTPAPPAAFTPTPGPDDFPFPSSQPEPQAAAQEEDDAAQALAAGGMSPPPSFFTPSPAPSQTPVPEPEPLAMRAPPPVAAPAPPLDPFGMVSQGSPADSYYGDDNPDATRVAAVPKELLQASASSMPANAGASAVARPLGGVPSVAAPAVDPEEQHFHDVFQDFVATRARCGEPSEGVTYDKFVAKLRKNRDQLVQKYACRTVRFQVYVKEGKAALKATPVKD